MTQIIRTKLEKRREKLLTQLAAEQQRSTNVLNGLGHGYAMRAYHRLKSLSFTKEDSLQSRLDEVEKQLTAQGWKKPGAVPTAELSEAEQLRHYCEVMGLPLPAVLEKEGREG